MMLGQSTFVGLGMTNEDLEPCTYQIQTLMGIFEKACGFTKDWHFGAIEPQHPTN